MSLLDWWMGKSAKKHSGKNKQARHNLAERNRGGRRGSGRRTTTVTATTGTSRNKSTNNSSNYGNVNLSYRGSTVRKASQSRAQERAKEREKNSWENYVNNILNKSEQLKEKKQAANTNQTKKSSAGRRSNYARQRSDYAKQHHKELLEILRNWATGDEEWNKLQREKQKTGVSGLGTPIKKHTETHKLSDTSRIIESEADRQVRKYMEEKEALEKAKENFKAGYNDDILDAKIEKPKNIKKQKAKDMSSQPRSIHEEGKTITYKYTDLSQEDYSKMTTAAMTGQLNNLMKSDKKLAKKVADKNVDDYVKGAFGAGALDQMTLGTSVSDDSVYKYSKIQKDILEDVKKTGTYNFGKMAGGIAEFGLGGTGTLGASLAKTAGKAALKEAAKKGGKELAKTTAKNVGKEVLGDTVASVGLNSLDALKAAYEDGKFDKETFAKELALNVGGDMVLGGVVGGVSHGISANSAKKYIKLKGKIAAGGELTDSERKFYQKTKKDIENDAIRRESEKAVKEVKARYKEAEKVHKIATKTQKEMDSVLKEISNDMGLNFEEFTPKSVDSMVNKVTRKQKEGKDYNIYSMKDHTRNKVELKSYDQAPEFLQKLQSKGIKYETEIVETPLGYKGLHVTYRNANGLGSEIQLTTPQAWRVKQESDKIYDKWRNIDKDSMTSAERAKYEADVEASEKMWSQLDLSALNSGNSAISSLDKGLPFNTSPQYKGERAGIHLSSTNSKSASGDSAIIRPDSVNTNLIKEPPNKFNNIIPQKSGNFKNDLKGDNKVKNINKDSDISDNLKKQEVDVNTNKGEQGSSTSYKWITDADRENYMNSGKRSVVHEKQKDEFKILRNKSEVANYIEESLSSNNKEIRPYGIAGQKLVEDVKVKSKGNVDVSGKWLEIPSEKIRHSSAEHMNVKMEGDLPLTKEDFNNIPEYMNEYDDILEITETKNGTRIIAGKEVNGFSIVTEMVSKGRNSIKFNNMWKVKTSEYIKIKEKSRPYLGLSKDSKTHQSADQLFSGKGNSKVFDEKSPNFTPKNDARLMPSNNNIHNKTENINANIFDDSFELAAQKAVDDAKYMPDYKTAGEAIKNENPNPKDFNKKSRQITKDEIPRIRQTAAKLYKQVDDDVAEIMSPWIKEGLLNKKTLQTQEEAISAAQNELKDNKLFDLFMDSKFENNEHLFMARAKVLLEHLMKKASNDNNAAEQLLKVVDKATDASSSAGRALNATKLLLRSTPEGRLRIINKEVKNLNSRFGDRLKGKKLKLDETQINRIIGAEKEADVEKAMDEITKEMWEQIPATGFEKFNEFRHMSMLGNPKTHLRNLTGNAVFSVARTMSDAMEIAAYKIPAVKKKVDKLGGKVEMVSVSKADIKKNNDYLNEIFDINYRKSNSKNRYIESTRPEGVSVFKSKVLSKPSQKNYNLLEKEDLLVLKPTYKKNYVRWCKANNIPLDKMSSMTKEQMRRADSFAMKQAEYATFRDASAFANKIVGLKQSTAGKRGATVLGTAGYRAANATLESVLPFVKTPVNVLRRSVDYSPVGLIRSMAELSTAKSADVFMQGIKHLTTGLTGTGVAALGMLLAGNELITVKAGEKSGDAYYDRDMGYQDYSLVLNFGGKEYSLTIDWLAPMQTSLFMGAAMYNNLSEGMTVSGMFDCLTAISGPMLDMSFMSSAKDTIETFTEKVYRNGTGEDADWSGAVAQTIFGSVPQGYLSSFVPQLVNQTAQAFDNKQRDTRSTKEDPVLASWDRFGKTIINKIPGLRNYVLNPKLDRFGDDKVTGNNIVTRMINSYINPSTVKEIKLTDRDKKLIDIYNHLDSDDKKYFFYNFTGNPSYDLGNGKRMTYDEAYKYGKEKRRNQTKLMDDMFNSTSYKNMTYDMKAKELDDAHWISQTIADKETYGVKFAVSRIIEGNDSEKETLERLKYYGGSEKDFYDAYIAKERLIARTHDSSDSSYQTKAIAIAGMGSDVEKAYNIYGEKIDVANQYFKDGGSKKEYSNAMCNVMSTINKAEVGNKIVNKAVAAAYHKINNRTYRAMGLDNQTANMGVGLKKYGYNFKSLRQMENDASMEFDEDHNNSLNKSEVISYIDSLGLETNEEKACVFRYFSNARNPYGNIPNYLEADIDDSVSSGYGRSYGRGYSRRGHSGTSEQTWEDYVSDFLVDYNAIYARTSKPKFDSPLTEAYRKKIDKLIKNA